MEGVQNVGTQIISYRRPAMCFARKIDSNAHANKDSMLGFNSSVVWRPKMFYHISKSLIRVVPEYLYIQFYKIYHYLLLEMWAPWHITDANNDSLSLVTKKTPVLVFENASAQKIILFRFKPSKIISMIRELYQNSLLRVMASQPFWPTWRTATQAQYSTHSNRDFLF